MRGLRAKVGNLFCLHQRSKCWNLLCRCQQELMKVNPACGPIICWTLQLRIVMLSIRGNILDILPRNFDQSSLSVYVLYSTLVPNSDTRSFAHVLVTYEEPPSCSARYTPNAQPMAGRRKLATIAGPKELAYFPSFAFNKLWRNMHSCMFKAKVSWLLQRFALARDVGISRNHQRKSNQRKILGQIFQSGLPLWSPKSKHKLSLPAVPH